MRSRLSSRVTPERLSVEDVIMAPGLAQEADEVRFPARGQACGDIVDRQARRPRLGAVQVCELELDAPQRLDAPALHGAPQVEEPLHVLTVKQARHAGDRGGQCDIARAGQQVFGLRRGSEELA